MKAKILNAGMIVVFSTLACQFLSPTVKPTLSQPVPTVEQSIGRATGLHSLVEHALSSSVFNPLVDPEDMFNGDRFRVTQGGESLLDFGDSVRLHLFNDTATGDVRSKCAPGAPLEVSMQLEYGGFTGEVVEKGAKAQFRTPGFATIYVYGTQFFITYDPETAITYVGNFSGTVNVESGGILVDIPPGHYRKSLPGVAPQANRPIHMDMPEFETQMLSELSPVKVARALDGEDRIATAVAQTIAARVTPSATITPTASKMPTPAPSHTPTLTLTPTPGPCFVYSYSLLDDGKLLLAFKFSENLSGNYTAVIDNQHFDCEILPQYPNRLYCHGPYPPVGKVVDINIYSFDPYKDTGQQICYKSFKVPFIPTPTPTVHRKKTKTPIPYSPYPSSTY